MTPATQTPWRSLLAPSLTTLIGVAVLVALGVWQLERRAWKQDLIRKIEARAYGALGALPPESEWPAWPREAEEYRRVRVAGRLLYEGEVAVHGLMSGRERGQPLQGFYLLTPLRLRDGAIVIVNRGFVPGELRDPGRRPGSDPEGEVAFTGLVRAPETRGLFMPENDPARNQWFLRSPDDIARTKELTRVAPFLVDADAMPSPAGWPKGGQTRLSMPNDHLQYALTWFGLALTLASVFAGFAWRRLRPDPTLVPVPREP
jgi:surfeit locus 1 family protein